MTWTTRPRSDSHGLAMIREGDGPVVLLLHGVGLQADAWLAQIQALSQYFQMIAPDMPGHGQSARLDGPASLAAFSDRAAALLEEPAVVVGHSMGAMIALDLAARFPGKILGVAALNAIFRRSEAAREAVLRRAEGLGTSGIPDPEPTLIRWFGQKPSGARSACETWLRSVDLESYRTAYGVFAEEDGPSEAALRSLSCPALFMTGGQEPNSTPAMSGAMAALVPKGRGLVIDDAAHMMPMTHSDEVNRALLAFVRECHK